MTRPAPHIVKAKKREIQIRHRNGRKFSMAPKRLAEIDRLLVHRYGRELPDDDAGRDDALIMLHHFAHGGDALNRMTAWMARRAPWMPPGEANALIDRVFAKPIKWGAETMGKRLRLTWAERTKLKIGTVWAFDITREEAAAIQAQTRRISREAKRRLKGAKPRHEYEASAIGHAKPWIAEGISKATWYRRQKQASPQLQ
ncbi:hypothetical protein I3J27_18400 [Bradyrhizobium xenonodulans]|uniref:Uncharacterized protein n=1 Tax=Bradyrhizobium xenonodulans TaxID=2736875 RepID=A0ABY7MVT4_9BRAD|nr:hypothetical protein [Bradyrhizobium xenonodulans]WBL82304.1 hypothetical protein I3J27_18400 [Bradyrhizobium xenonodulans]